MKNRQPPGIELGVSDFNCQCSTTWAMATGWHVYKYMHVQPWDLGVGLKHLWYQLSPPMYKPNMSDMFQYKHTFNWLCSMVNCIVSRPKNGFMWYYYYYKLSTLEWLYHTWLSKLITNIERLWKSYSHVLHCYHNCWLWTQWIRLCSTDGKLWTCVSAPHMIEI